MTEVAISCSECAGACCTAGIRLPLTKREAAQLESAGTSMRKLPKEEREGNRPGFRRDFYEFLGNCGNLSEQGDCLDYENRPGICVDFPVGSLVCRAVSMRYSGTAEPVLIGMPTLYSDNKDIA